MSCYLPKLIVCRFRLENKTHRVIAIVIFIHVGRFFSQNKKFWKYWFVSICLSLWKKNLTLWVKMLIAMTLRNIREIGLSWPMHVFDFVQVSFHVNQFANEFRECQKNAVYLFGGGHPCVKKVSYTFPRAKNSVKESVSPMCVCVCFSIWKQSVDVCVRVFVCVNFSKELWCSLIDVNGKVLILVHEQMEC